MQAIVKSSPSGRPPAAAVRAQAPIEHHERAAEHSAEVREVRDAGLSAGDAEEELDDRITRDEEPCRYGNGEVKQDPGAWEEQREGEQDAEYPSGGSQRGLAVAEDIFHRKLRHARGNDTHEVVPEEAPPAPVLLERGAEHVEREHVEEDVPDRRGVVKEGIRHELPRTKERLRHRERTEREVHFHGHPRRALEKIHEHVDQDDRPRGGGELRKHWRSL